MASLCLTTAMTDFNDDAGYFGTERVVVVVVVRIHIKKVLLLLFILVQSLTCT